MLKVIVAALFIIALSGSPVFALSLSWDPIVQVDIDGNPLSPGNLITAVKVYRCQGNSCNLLNATLVGTVPLPATKFNIDSQPRPSTYFVTAVNISAESSESNTVRVTPARPPIATIVVP